MAIGTPWTGTTYYSASAETSATIDITGATDGEVVYCFWTLGKTQGGAVTITGWNSVIDGDDATASSHYSILSRVKQPGDTTFTVNWPTSGKAIIDVVSWPGVDTTTPDEGAAYANHSSGTSFTTASVSPGSNDRWAVMYCYSRNASGIGTYTPDAALTERVDWGNASSVYVYAEIADSNGAVSGSSHTYTATSSQSESKGGAILFYLIPAASGPSVTGDLSGSGTLAANGVMSVDRTASLSGGGTLGASGTASITASAALSGTGTLTASFAAQAAFSSASEGVLTGTNLVATQIKHFFTPPTYVYNERHGRQQDALFGRLQYDQIGYTVLKSSGFYTQVQDPDAEQITAADVAYLGGHIYEITEAEAAALTAAGYGPYLTTGY